VIKKSRWINERSLLALALLLIPVGLLLSTRGLQFANLGGAFSPMFFPSIALWLWIGFAAINLLTEAASLNAQTQAPLWRVIAIGLGMIAYAVAMKPLGFLLTSFVFCVICLVSLGLRRLSIVILFSILMPGLLLLLFNYVLMLPLPNSPWTHRF
jgi:hypothetical protein